MLCHQSGFLGAAVVQRVNRIHCRTCTAECQNQVAAHSFGSECPVLYVGGFVCRIKHCTKSAMAFSMRKRTHSEKFLNKWKMTTSHADVKSLWLLPVDNPHGESQSLQGKMQTQCAVVHRVL